MFLATASVRMLFVTSNSISNQNQLNNKDIYYFIYQEVGFSPILKDWINDLIRKQIFSISWLCLPQFVSPVYLILPRWLQQFQAARVNSGEGASHQCLSRLYRSTGLNQVHLYGPAIGNPRMRVARTHSSGERTNSFNRNEGGGMRGCCATNLGMYLVFLCFTFLHFLGRCTKDRSRSRLNANC